MNASSTRDAVEKAEKDWRIDQVGYHGDSRGWNQMITERFRCRMQREKGEENACRRLFAGLFGT